MSEKEQWHWQEPGEAWKGVGIYWRAVKKVGRAYSYLRLSAGTTDENTPVPSSFAASSALSLIAPPERRDTPLRDMLGSDVYGTLAPIFTEMPFISKQEKMVQDVLLREGHPFIYIADNGFSDYYKPSAALFDAVAAGRVLILSPWPYDPGKKRVTMAQCAQMNKMAEEICGM